MGREAAITLLRRLRRQDMSCGVRNSGIAFDVLLFLYERTVSEPPVHVSVDMLSATLGYSGPTIRLVLKRLSEAGEVEASRRVGKTQLYTLTRRGLLAAEAYIRAVLDFRGETMPAAGVSAAADPALLPSPQ